jgi:hypothetical protein
MMDLSEKYIRMCDCDEVQDFSEKCGLDDGDFYCTRDGKVHVFVDMNNENWRFVLDSDEYTWLPRQDQIQGMISNPSGIWVHRYNRFHGFVTAESRKNHEWALVHDTPEKGWLAFYMYENHGKTWDGDKWVKL